MAASLPVASIVLLGMLLVAAAPAPDEAEDRAQYIDGLYSRGLLEMTVDESTDFLGDFDNHGLADRVRYRLASALFDLGRVEDSTPHFRKLSNRINFPNRPEVLLRLGQCEIQAGRHGVAVEALRQVQSLGDEYLRIPAMFLQAEAEFGRERFADAAVLYEQVLAEQPDGTYGDGSGAALTWCALRMGDHERAASLATRRLTMHPSPALRSELQFLLGEAHLEGRQPTQALTAYALVDDGPFADAALRGQGFAHALQNDHLAAATDFELLLQRHPDSRFVPEATLQLGIHRLQAGDAQAAWAALSMDTLPETADSSYWKARARANLGDTDGALMHLDRAQALGPSPDLQPHIHAARGDVLSAAGRSSEAARAYQTAGSAEALHAAAVVRLNSGDAEGALGLLSGVPAGDGATDLTRGEALFALGRYEDAEPHLRSARDSGPVETRPRAASRLAWCAFLREDFGEATPEFERVIRDHAGTGEAVEALFMEGRSRRRTGDDTGAARAWERYLSSHRDGMHRPDVLLGLSELTDGTERRNYLESLIADHPDSPLVPRALFDLAESYSGDGLTRAAEAPYRRILAEYGNDPVAPAARYGLAWCLVEREAEDEALVTLVPLTEPRQGPLSAEDHELLASALELKVWCETTLGKPADAEVSWQSLTQLGLPAERTLASARSVSEAWVIAGRPDRAQSVLKTLGSAEGVSVDALVAAAWIAYDAGRLDEAEEHLGEARARDPDDGGLAEACFFVADARFEAGDDARAIPLYAACSAAAQSTLADQALYKEGFARLRSADLRGAESCFDRLVRDHDDSPLKGESMFLAGEACYQDERLQDAVSWLSRATQEVPGHQVIPKVRFRLGVSLARLGEWDAAEPVLAELARSSPDFENLLEAELWRGRTLAALGHTRAARGALERVVTEDRGLLAARARLDLGRLHMSAGENEEALAQFLKVAVLYAHDEEVATALLLAGECLQRLGDDERARHRYQEILDSHPDSSVAAEARRRLSAL